MKGPGRKIAIIVVFLILSLFNFTDIGFRLLPLTFGRIVAILCLGVAVFYSFSLVMEIKKKKEA